MTGTPTVRPAYPFDPTADAAALKKAMKGLGTDENAIIDILAHRSNDQRQEIIHHYNHGFGKDLLKDLKHELHGKFEDVVVALMTPLPTYLAHELHHAMEGKGTKEHTLIEILCTRHNHSIKAIKEAFHHHYGKTLEHELKGDTSGELRKLLVGMASCERDDDCCDHELSPVLAKELYKAGEGRVGTDEETLRRILTSYSFPQLRQVFHEYHKLANKSLMESLDDELSGDFKVAMKAVVLSIQNPAAYFAEQIHKAMAGLGTKNRALIRLVVSRCEVDMVDIKREYHCLYNKSLEKDIKGDTHGDYKKVLLALIEG